MIKVLNVVGARPNFMKMAPIIRAMDKYPDKIRSTLVHTGQHYDKIMSKAFFDDLGMPEPDIDLGVGSGSHSEQTGKIMVEFEKVCLKEMPNLVIVVGDVNSTMACTITAKKLNIKVAHVEAGLRSRDMTMPEEINRLCTDVLCDYLFTTDYIANENLILEGIGKEKIFFVGNVMIDSLLSHVEKAGNNRVLEDYGLTSQQYGTVTIHRPSNVDNRKIFCEILEALAEIGKNTPLVFPVHPRTEERLRSFELSRYVKPLDRGRGPIECGVWGTAPLGYLDFLALNMNARFVLTDSGGLQEETTVLKVPCVTLRHNTERPITVDIGSNIVVGNKKEKIIAAVNSILEGKQREAVVPEKWDGLAAERIVDILVDQFDSDNI